MKLRVFGRKKREGAELASQEVQSRTAELREAFKKERLLLDDLETFRVNHAYRMPGQVLNPLYK